MAGVKCNDTQMLEVVCGPRFDKLESEIKAVKDSVHGIEKGQSGFEVKVLERLDQTRDMVESAWHNFHDALNKQDLRIVKIEDDKSGVTWGKFSAKGRSPIGVSIMLICCSVLLVSAAYALPVILKTVKAALP